jgi:hypothetical protein
MTYRRLVPLLPSRISQREDAVVSRAGFSNEARSLALRPWDKSNNFADIRSKHMKWRQPFHLELKTHCNLEVLQW